MPGAHTAPAMQALLVGAIPLAGLAAHVARVDNSPLVGAPAMVDFYAD